ncbi:MAG: hypothetical protein ACP5PZ_00280 [Bacteroidales bacterium]
MKFSSQFAWIYFIFGLIIALLISVFGLILLFSKSFSYVPENFRSILGVFLIVYGLFRVISNLMRLKKDNENEDNH